VSGAGGWPRVATGRGGGGWARRAYDWLGGLFLFLLIFFILLTVAGSDPPR